MVIGESDHLSWVLEVCDFWRIRLFLLSCQIYEYKLNLFLAFSYYFFNDWSIFVHGFY
jgi:hypothetical protein